MIKRPALMIGLLIAIFVLRFASSGVANADEAQAPLRYKHVGNTIELHSHLYPDPYLVAGNPRRVIRVVLERLSVNRQLTAEEIAVFFKYEDGNDENGVPNSRPLDSFRKRSGGAIYWILDGEIGTKLEAMTPLGVVYCSGEETCGPIFKHYAADIIWHPGRQQYLLFLAMSCSHNFSVAIFPFDLDRKLDVKPFAFADKQPMRLDGPQTAWPEPLPMISEMRTYLPDGMCDVMNIRAVPELRNVPDQIEERNLLISGWNTVSAGDTCNSVTYRYRLRQYKWTRVTFDEQIEVPVEMKSAGDNKLTEFLETFPKEQDPGGKRGKGDPDDLLPEPDPDAQQRAPDDDK